MKDIIKGTLVWVVCGVILGPPLVILLAWKWLVILIAKCCRRDLVPLWSSNAMMSLGKSHDKSIIRSGFLLRLNSSKIEVEDLRNLWKEKFLGSDLKGLPGYENLLMSVDIFGGFAFGKKVVIKSLEDFINKAELEEGGDLEGFLDNWLQRKYKKDTPCWELTLIRMRGTGETAVAFQMHHAFADGYSTLHILDKMTGNHSPYLVKDGKDSFMQKVVTIAKGGSNLFGSILGDGSLSNLKCDQEEARKLNFTFVTLNLRTLKAIRKAHNVHMVSVVMSLIAGTMKRYHRETKAISNEFDQLSTVPLLALTSEGWPNHPAKVYKSYPTLGNHVSHLIFNVSTIENPVERLLETERSYRESLEGGMTRVWHQVLYPIFGMLPVRMFNRISGNLSCDAFHSATGIGGNDYNLLGAQITHINSIGAMSDANQLVPLAVASFSHSNLLEITLVSCGPKRIPDRETLKRIVDVHLQSELKELIGTV